jgi:DNA-binding CsgD family transcriptional regulator
MFSSEFLDQIYEAAFIPGLWKGILDTLATSTNARGTLLISATDAREQAIASESLAAFMKAAPEWQRINHRGKLLLTLPNAEFHSDADHFSEAQMAADPLYRDYLWPHGIGYAAATHIKVPNGDTLILSIERPHENGPFDRAEIDALTALRPHLARSAMLASRLEYERIRGANHAMQMTGLASAAMTAAGTILDCNELFARHADQVQIGANDRIRLAYAPANSFLASCLDSVRLSASDTGRNSRSFALPRTETAEPAVIHLLPLRGDARDLFSRAALFMVITPLDKGNIAPGEIIQGLFDLTVTEAKIAREIAIGMEPGQIAAKFGVSVETVRVHLKSIFAKTGFSRQADLAATIAGIRSFT